MERFGGLLGGALSWAIIDRRYIGISVASLCERRIQFCHPPFPSFAARQRHVVQFH